MKRYVIDSYAMLAFFEDEPGADRVGDILKELMDKKSKGYMSVVNWGEIYYTVFRVKGKKTADAVIKQLDQYPIEFVDADRRLTHQAAIYKGKCKIAYADCFAAALASNLKAVVVTGDQEFKELADEIDIEWLV